MNAVVRTVDELRSIGLKLLETQPETTFAVLLGSPAGLPAGEIEFGQLSSRLSNVLRRWKGLTWDAYMSESPSTLLARRNCGIKSLGEFVLAAADAAHSLPPLLSSPTGPIPAVDTPSIEAPPIHQLSGEGSVAAQPLDDDSNRLSMALRTIAAWAYFERGRGSIRQALELSWSEDPPPSVGTALEALDGADLATWTAPLALEFSVVGQVATIEKSLSNRDRDVLSRRTLALAEGETLEAIGREHDITRERLRQVQVKAEHELRSKVGSRSSTPIARAARRLHDELGSAVPLSQLRGSKTLQELDLMGVDSFAVRLLFWIAGPYEQLGDWLVARPARVIVSKTKSALQSLAPDGAPVPVSEVEASLASLGIREHQAVPWITSLGGYRVLGDALARWSGSLADKAETVLVVSGSPLHQEELFDRLGEGRSLRSLLNQVQGDSRFIRTGLRTYGLSRWSHDEYTSVADEIAQEIERNGGSAHLDHLVRYVSETYGVSPSSVRAYAAGPRFDRQPDGRIAVRTVTPFLRVRKAKTSVRGMLWFGGRWGFRTVVSEALLGGSGIAIPEAFAEDLGLVPFGSLELRGELGAVRFSWPSLQPNVGSIRPYLERSGAHAGDHILLIPGLESTLEVVCVRQVDRSGREGMDLLAFELGLKATERSVASIAERVGLDPTTATIREIWRCLQGRGDAELAGLIDEPERDGAFLDLSSSSKFVEVRWSS